MAGSSELINHISDLARRSYERNIYTFSGFLSLAEQSEVHSAERELSFTDVAFFGGTQGCERQMVRFGSERLLGYEEDFPISILEIKPLNAKFADILTHRDYLGAILSLGIKREILGDIIVRDNVGYVFCDSSMADFVSENLVSIKHTTVVCSVSDKCPESAEPVFSEAELIISSNRCDALIAGLYKLSRSKSQDLFREGLVFINGRQTFSSSAEIKEGSAVSVRGYGKFIFDGVKATTGKGRIRVLVRKYI